MSIFGEKGNVGNQMAGGFATGNSLTISSFSASPEYFYTQLEGEWTTGQTYYEEDTHGYKEVTETEPVEGKIYYTRIEIAKNPAFTRHLILGDLSNTGIDGLNMQGQGLYCDNVFLKGALVTKSLNYYSGINSYSKASFNKIGKNSNIIDNTNIIFWGGASGATDEEAGGQTDYGKCRFGMVFH